MISILILMIFIGCFFMYNTSKKAQLEKNTFIDVWLQTNRKRTKALAISLLVLTLTSASFFFGLTSGILFWLFTVTLLLSLIVVMYPLKLFKTKHLIILFTATLIFEIILTN